MKGTNTEKKGLTINRFFTKDKTSVYDQYQYDIRSSVIKTPSGESIFEMNNVEVPKGWSQVATDILSQKYFRKAGVPITKGKNGQEDSIKQVVHRMANDWKEWGIENNYFKTNKDADVFYDEVAFMILGQYAAPNSPQWFNTGLYRSYGIKGKAQGHYYVS